MMTVNLRKRTIPWPRPGSGRPRPIVSPGTIQEILQTGDRDLIDQAVDQMEDAGDYDAITRYMESLPDLPTLA